MFEAPGARSRALVVSTALLALLVVPLANAQLGDGATGRAAQVRTGETLRAEVRNGTTDRETEIIGDIDATNTGKGGFVTRQSNVQTGGRAGGAAIYGCRGAAGGTAGGSAPCLRATNLANGYAFEYATGGLVGGLISAGPNPAVPNPAARPFVTNATGVATGLNADRLDGLSAGQVGALPSPPNGNAGGSLDGTYPNPTLGANSVGGAQIAPDAVSGDELAAGSVGGGEIADAAVGSGEIADGAVGTAELASRTLGVAFAGVRVDADGSRRQAFNRRGGQPSATRTGEGQYTIDIPGTLVNFSQEMLAMATLVVDFGEVRVNHAGGDVLVRTVNSAGTPADRSFHLLLFDTAE